MRGPKKGIPLSDRLVDCQEDLKATFTSWVDLAQSVGWKETEICMALSELADNRMRASHCNQDTNAAIRAVLARYRREGPF